MEGRAVVCWMSITLMASLALGTNMVETPKADLVGKAVMQVDKRNIENGRSNLLPAKSRKISYNISPKDVALGQIDTIGSTTYDWQWNGPALQRIVFDPNNSFVHLIWTWSNKLDDPHFSDRQVYYNCYNPSSGWVFEQGMDGGEAPQSTRSGFGTIDILSDGRAVMALHRGPVGTEPATAVGVDLMAGLGAFVFSSNLSPSNVIWPRVSTTAEDHISVAAQHGDNDALYYSYSTDAGTNWSDFAYFGVSRGGHNNFASKNSDKVCMMWIRDFQEPCFNAHIMYAESDDGGQSWGRENDIMENIPLPDGNTYEWWQTRHSDFGGWGIYDSDGNPHFVFSANFGTRTGAGYYFPFLRNPIWHYSSATGVSLVTLSSPGVFPEGVKALNAYGNSHLADKPSLGEDENGYLYCVWGEFPPEHWDVSTGYPGDAEVYAARSMDNGATWGPKVNLTMTDSLCELYPTVAHVVNDTLHIIYHHDLELASYVQEDGPASDNPVIYHKVPVIPGDIEVVSIDDPPYWPDSTTYSDQIYIPKVTYHNKGTEIVAFQARFEIESPSYYSPLNEGADTIMSRSGFYYDIVDVSLDGGATTQVEFKEFDPSITLSSENPSFRPLLRYYGMACLLGDADISDNVKLDSCRVDTIVQEGIEESPALPFSLSISPNPSPGVARISYTLPSSDKITIRIFDLVGRCVVSAEEIKEAGNHTFLWNGSDDRGKELSSGVYFITLTSKSGTKGKKLLLMK